MVALGEVLERAGCPYVNEVYSGAAHGYTMADTSAYDEAAAERHFRALRRPPGREPAPRGGALRDPDRQVGRCTWSAAKVRYTAAVQV